MISISHPFPCLLVEFRPLILFFHIHLHLPPIQIILHPFRNILTVFMVSSLVKEMVAEGLQLCLTSVMAFNYSFHLSRTS